jgi:hypothetical protein
MGRAIGYSPRQSGVFSESGLLTCQSILKTAFVAAALSGALLLDGCGRRGPPIPLDPAIEKKSEAAPDSPEQFHSTANSQKPLPHGLDDNSLKVGAPKGPTPFDFLL